MTRPVSVSIAAIAGIVILEAIALLAKIDGRYFGIAIAAVAGIGGFFLSRAVPPKS